MVSSSIFTLTTTFINFKDQQFRLHHPEVIHTLNTSLYTVYPRSYGGTGIDCKFPGKLSTGLYTGTLIQSQSSLVSNILHRWYKVLLSPLPLVTPWLEGASVLEWQLGNGRSARTEQTDWLTDQSISPPSLPRFYSPTLSPTFTASWCRIKGGKDGQLQRQWQVRGKKRERE